MMKSPEQKYADRVRAINEKYDQYVELFKEFEELAAVKMFGKAFKDCTQQETQEVNVCLRAFHAEWETDASPNPAWMF